jgi:ABC-2 type transport system ATP-binding protein
MLNIEELLVKRSEAFSLEIPSLVVPAKRILCIAGPNGSGKTTLIACIAGLLAPTGGNIMLDGQSVSKDMRPIRAAMGYIPDEEDWFVKELSAREYFRLLERVYHDAGVTNNMPGRVDYLATMLAFTSFDQPLATLSHGNKKKVQIIAGLMHQPKVLIADELRNGLDPLAIITVEQLVRAEAKRGCCIIAATHDLWWAERIAHSILLLNNGKPVIHKRTATIIKEYGNLEALFMDVMQEHQHVEAL